MAASTTTKQAVAIAIPAGLPPTSSSSENLEMPFPRHAERAQPEREDSWQTCAGQHADNDYFPAGPQVDPAVHGVAPARDGAAVPVHAEFTFFGFTLVLRDRQ
jgi:hypothetical protein